MSIPGLGGRRNWKKESAGFFKAVEVMQGKYVKPKERKQRAVETKKRDMKEKILERDIIWNLTTLGCDIAKSGEQSTYNSQYVLEGMSDLIVFVPNRGVIFMECKQEKYRNTKDGGLRKSQVKFKAICEKCGIKYIVVYSIEEARKAVLDD